MKYFDGRRWTGKEIIADLDKRRRTEGWVKIRKIVTIMTRGSVITAYSRGTTSDYGGAISDLEFALDVLDEGNKLWATVPYDTRGNGFRPSLTRMFQTELLRLRQEGHALAQSDSARKAFSLDKVEEDALALIAGNQESEWITQDRTNGGTFAYHIVPLSKAYAALAYVAAVQGCEPVRPGTIPSGEVRPANLEKVQEADQYYDLAFDLLPDDYHVKPAFGFMALEQHLRAGGLTARELFERYEDVELMRIDIARFFTGLNELNSARSFVEQQVEAIRDYVGENPSSSWDQTIKPIRSINLHGVAEDDQGIDMVFWLNLPGQIGIADVWGSNKVLRVTTFA